MGACVCEDTRNKRRECQPRVKKVPITWPINTIMTWPINTIFDRSKRRKCPFTLYRHPGGKGGCPLPPSTPSPPPSLHPSLARSLHPPPPPSTGPFPPRGPLLHSRPVSGPAPTLGRGARRAGEVEALRRALAELEAAHAARWV